MVDVAAAQYADEMLSSAVDGALKAPDMLTLAGEPMTVSTTTVGSAWTVLIMLLISRFRSSRAANTLMLPPALSLTKCTATLN